MALIDSRVIENAIYYCLVSCEYVVLRTTYLTYVRGRYCSPSPTTWDLYKRHVGTYRYRDLTQYSTLRKLRARGPTSPYGLP